MYSQAYQKRHSFLHHAFFESYKYLWAWMNGKNNIHKKEGKNCTIKPTGTSKKDTAFCHAFLRQYNNTTM